MQVIPAHVQPVRIVLADDHDLVRSGIKALLVQIPGVAVVAEARDGTELIEAVERSQPDIVMTDISMPGMDGLSAVAKLHALYPQVRVVVVSTHDTVDFIKGAVANGACGYLTKDASPLELEQALRNVMANGSYFSSLIARRLLQPAEPTVDEVLTVRQIEILRLLAQGKASKEIAYQLGLSPRTVDVHRSRMMERLGLHDVSSLTRYAIRKKLIQA
ncbi:MAG: response regulator transcription factor [Gammaproteobacteria bacterium]|nr:response regulator transcription factor [Gammaproteobacteria bacterium]